MITKILKNVKKRNFMLRFLANRYYSPGLIAPTGQTEAHEPQSMHCSSILY